MNMSTHNEIEMFSNSPNVDLVLLESPKLHVQVYGKTIQFMSWNNYKPYDQTLTKGNGMKIN
jgi:hypothetical protein